MKQQILIDKRLKMSLLRCCILSSLSWCLQVETTASGGCCLRIFIHIARRHVSISLHAFASSRLLRHTSLIILVLPSSQSTSPTTLSRATASHLTKDQDIHSRIKKAILLSVSYKPSFLQELILTSDPRPAFEPSPSIQSFN